MTDTTRKFIQDIADQMPEKPDHWSACGQCERNAQRARDFLEAAISSANDADREAFEVAYVNHLNKQSLHKIYGMENYNTEEINALRNGHVYCGSDGTFYPYLNGCWDGWKLAIAYKSICENKSSTLFDAIKHGDEVHREWLKEAISAHFAGLPVPPARAAMPVQTQSILAGYKLVPIEPTETMVVCGFESEPDELFSSPEEWAAFEAMSGCQQAAHKARLCYAAMLNFAPEPPECAAFSDDQIVAAARVLCNRSADAMNINREDNWAIYGADYLADAKAMLEAALQSKDATK